MSIAENILLLKKSIPENVTIVTVSKMQPVSALIQAYDAGQRVFGENKAQELVVKHSQLPKDIEWHFIGHLQRNKVKFITPFISLIHSIDSIDLLNEVNREAFKNNRVVDCLLQFHISREETKFGLDINGANEILESEFYQGMTSIRIVGVMGMSSFSDDTGIVRSEFKSLYDRFLNLKSCYFRNQDAFKVVSMGMSGDYLIALEEGSTMVRIGTSIFGERNSQ